MERIGDKRQINLMLPAGEILRFGTVGILATLVHFGTLSVGVAIADLSPVLMNSVAFCFAAAVTYSGQSFWVFRIKHRNLV